MIKPRLTFSFLFLLIWGLILPNHPPSAEPIPEKWSQLLKEIVEINSGTRHLEGNETVRARLIPEFERLGLQASVHELEAGHKLLSFEAPGARPELVLIGHIDTVFPKDASFTKLTRDGDRLMGPGVIDMKGGIILILQILEDLKGTGLLKKIRILLNDDEEIGSPYSNKKMRELVRGVKYGLVYEPGLPDGSVVTSQSGIQWLELTTTGKAAHAGMEPERGINACVELSHKIIETSKLARPDKKLTINAGVISGGTKANVVCEKASVKLDIRYVDKADLDWTLAAIEAIGEKNYVYNPLLKASPTTETKLTIRVPSMPETATIQIFKQAQEAARSLGKELEGRHVGYGSDANLLYDLGTQFLVGMGPYGGGMHTEEEFMLPESYEDRLELNLALIKRILSP